jgi:hypothetical protein
MSDTLGTRPATKRFAITALIVANLCLVAALLSACFALPATYAQGGGRGGEYVCVTAKPAGQTYDVLYVLDPAAHKLHAFYPGLPQSKQLSRAEPRDLKKDFDK